MRARVILFLLLAINAGCQKTKKEDELTPGGGGTGSTNTINLTQHAPATVSAAPVAFFRTNRQGTTFLISIYEPTGKVITYAGNSKKWDKLGEFLPASAAVSETGTVIYFEKNELLKRYTGTGSPETITALPNINYPRVIAGHDDKIYVSSSNSKVYSTTDDGKTWVPTDIAIDKFVYNGQLPIAFFAYPGKLYSYSDKSFSISTDGGKTWQKQLHVPTFANSGFVDRYAPVSQDLNGLVYIKGATGVTVLDMQNSTSKSIAFQSAGLSNSFEEFAHFTSDPQGNVYGSINTLGYDYENKKTAGSIYKYSGGNWQKLQSPGTLTGFNNMPLYYTQAGIISAANGMLSKGLYSIDATGQLKDIGIPETAENNILSIAPHNNGKVFAVLRHATANNLNPSYSSLMMFENGQWKSTGLASDQVFVTSTGDIYSIQNLEVNLSKDGGLSWQKGTLSVDDPQNLRNLLSSETRHFTELKGEIHMYLQLHFGGVGGIYTNFGWTKTIAGSTSFDKILPKPGSYNPAIKQVPLVTGNKGMNGFFFKPFNGYSYIPVNKEEVLYTKDGGVTYTPAQFPLPFAGSNSGSFIAYGLGGFMTSAANNPLSFSTADIKIAGTALDIQPYIGSNYFVSWARFSTDNKLYLNIKNKIYISDKAF